MAVLPRGIAAGVQDVKGEDVCRDERDVDRAWLGEGLKGKRRRGPEEEREGERLASGVDSGGLDTELESQGSRKGKRRLMSRCGGNMIVKHAPNLPSQPTPRLAALAPQKASASTRR